VWREVPVYFSIALLQTFECSRVAAIPEKARHTECWPSWLVENTATQQVPCKESQEELEAPQTTTVGDMCQRWGTIGNLGGLLSSFCIFSDNLTSSHFSILYQRGEG